MARRQVHELIVAGIYLCSLLYTIQGIPDYSGLPPGPYCGLRYRELKCCYGRQDDCSVPIIGTRCYCDDFCSNRTGEPDCCPDYWSFCRGEKDVAQPITDLRCNHRGRYYEQGQTTKYNCNVCKCSTFNNKVEMLCEENRCMIEQDILDRVNIVDRSTWRAQNYSDFWGQTLSDAILLKLGTLDPAKSVYKMHVVHRRYHASRLPREFDARLRWPNEIAKVHDQGWCGASWAISTVDVASDRFAVRSKGAETVDLSAQQLISCNRKGQRGCRGGYIHRAWYFIRKFGLVEEDCCPWLGTNRRCDVPRGGKLSDVGCQERNSYDRKNQMYRVGPAYRLDNETDIMHDITISGSVQATMRVYQDFFAYEEGIYKHSKIAEAYPSGYHSVRIIGWGEEISPITRQPIKYWRVVNSWGEDWGERGLFRIERGTNECEIESFVVAVWPRTI